MVVLLRRKLKISPTHTLAPLFGTAAHHTIEGRKFLDHANRQSTTYLDGFENNTTPKQHQHETSS
jgi:hypothetical protein